MRVAVVHDWLNGIRGGEKVLEALLDILPNAELFTLFHEPGKVSRAIESLPITTSFLQKMPGVFSQYRNYLPLFPKAIESLDLSGFDLILSSSHAVAKGVRTGHAKHICYCHTPMRYIWDAEDDYRMSPAKRLVFRALRPYLRRWDVESSERVSHFIANSHFVASRIRKYYGRESDVVPPPIDTDFLSPSSASVREDFYLCAGALVPYKRVDVTIRAFNALGKRLIVAGTGPEQKNLRGIASANVDVRGWVSDDALRHLYRTAKALVYMAREDFGMAAVEAHACGCPVIAFAEGGLLETVQDGVNGLFFLEQTAESVTAAVRRFESREWPVEVVSEGVEKYSRAAFQTKIRQIIETHVPEFAGQFQVRHRP